jgi:uncharacterized membrane-anchored protein
LLLILAGPVSAQPKTKLTKQDLDYWHGITWQQGPAKAAVGAVADIVVPAGFKFTGPAGSKRVLEFTGNAFTPKTLAVLCPASYDVATIGNPGQWIVVFLEDEIGHVGDEDRNSLDADAMLRSLQSAQELANKLRHDQNPKLPTRKLLGWFRPPTYDAQKNLLTWATRVQSDGDATVTVNYNGRLLGRTGMMSANLVIDEPSLEKNVAGYQQVLQTFSFREGRRHRDFRAGDKESGLTLTRLIGGAAPASLWERLEKHATGFGLAGACIVIGVCGIAWNVMRRRRQEQMAA